jgi:hypothetical protein
VWSDADFNVQVARWPAISTGLTFTGQSNPIAVVHAGRNLNGEFSGFGHATAPMALFTGIINYCPSAFAGWAGLLN